MGSKTYADRMRWNRLELMVTQANRLTTEKDFLAAVVELAQAHNWLVHHVLEARHYAKRIGPGYPDLTLVRGNRLAFVELKSEKGKLSEPQRQWLDALSSVGKTLDNADHGPVETYVFRPHDWETIVEMLE